MSSVYRDLNLLCFVPRVYKLWEELRKLSEWVILLLLLYQASLNPYTLNLDECFCSHETKHCCCRTDVGSRMFSPHTILPGYVDLKLSFVAL